MPRKRYIVISFVAIHWLTCILFLVLRAPDPAGGELDKLEEIRGTGQFMLSTAAPWGYVAERPLYNWSEWHGGESSWVKAMVIANVLPTLITTAILESPDPFSSVPIRLQSWIVAVVYFGLSTLQWWGIGAVAERMARREAP